MTWIKGNIIDLAEDGVFTAIVHWCNCFCNMGAGLAKEIKQRYPYAYKIDQKTTFGFGLLCVAAMKRGIKWKTQK